MILDRDILETLLVPNKRLFDTPATIARALAAGRAFDVVLLRWYTQVKYQDGVVLLLMSQCMSQNSQQAPWCDITISTSSH